MTARSPDLDRGKEDKVMDLSIQRWWTGHDSWSTIRKRDLGTLGSEVIWI